MHIKNSLAIYHCGPTSSLLYLFLTDLVVSICAILSINRETEFIPPTFVSLENEDAFTLSLNFTEKNFKS